MFDFLIEVYKSGIDENKETKNEDRRPGVVNIPVYKWIKIDPKLCNGMAGLVAFDPTAVEPGSRYPSMFRACEDYLDIKVGI